MEEIKNLWIYQTYDVFKTYDTGVKLDYVILIFILFWIAIAVGKRLQDVRNKYWKTAFPFVLVFTFVEGLRYLRGVDYLNYALIFKYQGEPSSLTELIYLFVQQSFHALNVPYWFPFVFYSLAWCLGLLYLLKDYRQSIKYILPLFVLLSLGAFETFIRQSFAWGFVFMFMSELLKDNYKKALLFVICSVLIHNGAFVFILIILCVRLIKRPANPYLMILLYLFGMVAFNASNLSYLASLIAKIPYLGDTVFGSYIANADRWFSADAVRDKFARSLLTKVGTSFFDISIIILGYLKIKYMRDTELKRNSLFYYNLFCLTVALLQFVFTIEIPKRILTTFYGFAAFVLAWLFVDKTLINKYKSWYALLQLYLVVYFLKEILFASNQLFVWDNSGQYYFNL